MASEISSFVYSFFSFDVQRGYFNYKCSIELSYDRTSELLPGALSLPLSLLDRCLLQSESALQSTEEPDSFTGGVPDSFFHFQIRG